MAVVRVSVPLYDPALRPQVSGQFALFRQVNNPLTYIADGGQMLYEPQRVAPDPVTGIALLTIPRSDGFNPPAEWGISASNLLGAEYVGTLPNTITDNTLLTIEDLVQSFGWQRTQAVPPVETVPGLDAVRWVTPRAWDAATTYFPGEGVNYQGSSWQALLQNINSPPSEANANWTYIAIGAGSYGIYDALSYSNDLGTAIATISGLLSGTNGTVAISAPMTLAANATSPPNILLSFVNAGSVSVASGATLRILGAVLDAGPRRIFLASGLSNGSAGSGSISFAYPNWDSTKTYATGDRAINYGSLPAGVLWQATGSSLASTPRTNTVTGLTSGGTSIPTGAQTVNYRGTSLATNAPITVEPGTANEETTVISGAPTYSLKTGTGSFTATFTKAHTAPIEVTNPSWTRVVSVPEISPTGVVRPEWWGAKADSDVGQVNTDCSPAFNAMIGALPGRGGVEIRCTGGIYAFASTIKIDSFSNPNQKQDFTITGNYSPHASGSVGGTTFMWAGPSTWPTMASILAGTPIALTPLFECYSREVLTRGVFFTVANGYICDVLTDIDWASQTTSGGATNHADRFESCAWGFPLGYTAGISGQPRLGIRIGAKNLPNGEYHTVKDSEIMNMVPNGPTRGWWQQQWNYMTGDIVWWAGECYQSLVDNNLNHKPDVGLDTTLNPTRSAYWLVADPSIIGACGIFTPNTSAQVKSSEFKNCHFAGSRSNSATYATQQWGIYQQSGSFSADICKLFSMPQAIRILSPWDTIVIKGTDSEGCQQIYRADGSASAMPLTWLGGRLALAQVDTTTPVGGEYFHLNAGPNLIEGVAFNPGEATGVNPAFSIYAPSVSDVKVVNCMLPTFAFLVTDSVDAPFIIEGCKVKQGTGSANRMLPRMMGHGAVPSANSQSGSGIGSGSYTAPLSIGPFPTNVIPRILRPLSPNVHPMNLQIFKGQNQPLGQGVPSGAHNYQWTRWNGGVEYPVGTILTLSPSPTYTDPNGNATDGEIWLAPPPVAKPNDTKNMLYRNDPAVDGNYYLLTDVTIGTQSVIDIVHAVGPSTPYTTVMPSFPGAIEAGIYDWATAQANAAGLETDASDRFTAQFTTPVSPVLALPFLTAGTDHINTYRTKVFPGGTAAPAVALAAGSGMEDGKRVYAAAAIYDPITITNLTAGGTAITPGSQQVDYTGSFVPTVGQKLLVDFMKSSQERVTVTAVALGGGNFTAVFNKSHTAGATLYASSALSHMSTPSAIVTTSAAGNQSQVTTSAIPSTPAGTWRLLMRTKAGATAFTSSFFPVAVIQNNSSAVSYTDSATDASLPALAAFTPTLLKLPISASPSDYGNYLQVFRDDATADAALLTTAAQPNLLGTNQAVIESFHVTDGGARINGDVTIGGGQFSGQGALRLGTANGVPSTSASGSAGLYFDGTHLQVSEGGSAYQQLLAVTNTDVVFTRNLISTNTDVPTVDATNSTGAGVGVVASVTVSGTGTGYVNGAAVTFDNTGTGGTGAAGTLVVTGGNITGVTITVAGSGYVTAPTVTFPTGTGQTGIVVLSKPTWTFDAGANKMRGRLAIVPSSDKNVNFSIARIQLPNCPSMPYVRVGYGDTGAKGSSGTLYYQALQWNSGTGLAQFDVRTTTVLPVGGISITYEVMF